MKAEVETKLILDLAFLEEFNEDFHQWKKKKGRKGEGKEEKKKIKSSIAAKGKMGEGAKCVYSTVFRIIGKHEEMLNRP